VPCTVRVFDGEKKVEKYIANITYEDYAPQLVSAKSNLETVNDEGNVA
jgi:hypothetical protein